MDETLYVCADCNYVGPRVKVKPGSKGIELFLWLVLLVPGPFYSLWRILARKNGCPQCKSTTMVPKRDGLSKTDISDESLAKVPSILYNDKRPFKLDDFINKQTRISYSNDKQSGIENKPNITDTKNNKDNPEGW